MCWCDFSFLGGALIYLLGGPEIRGPWQQLLTLKSTTGAHTFQGSVWQLFIELCGMLFHGERLQGASPLTGDASPPPPKKKIHLTPPNQKTKKETTKNRKLYFMGKMFIPRVYRGILLGLVEFFFYSVPFIQHHLQSNS